MRNYRNGLHFWVCIRPRTEYQFIQIVLQGRRWKLLQTSGGVESPPCAPPLGCVPLSRVSSPPGPPGRRAALLGPSSAPASHSFLKLGHAPTPLSSLPLALPSRVPVRAANPEQLTDCVYHPETLTFLSP